MTSQALQAWRTVRAAHLEEMIAAHDFLGGITGPGRRTNTQAANWSLTLLLAAEFQGFARELHDETSDVLASFISNGNVALMTLVRNNMTAGRELDRVNAKPDSVRRDFSRLGVTRFWDQVNNAVSSGPAWKKSLDQLNEARNGIAHNDMSKIALLGTQGAQLNLRTIRRWRTACNGIARQLDIIVGKTVKKTIGSAPW